MKTNSYGDSPTLLFHEISLSKWYCHRLYRVPGELTQQEVVSEKSEPHGITSTLQFIAQFKDRIHLTR